MTTPQRQQIASLLGEIQDPELHRGLNELHMVRDLSVKGSSVAVTVALTVPNSAARPYYLEVIPAKIRNAFPQARVHVEFVVMSEDERLALSESMRKDTPAPMAGSDSKTQVIAIGSGKGGVGKSTTAVNLAASLAKGGYSVGLLDADVWGFSIPRMLGIYEKPAVLGDLIVPPEMFGVKIVSIGLFTSEENPVMWRGPMLHKALQQFLEDVHWGDPDYLLLDLPPGTGDVAMSIAQFIPGAAMITVTTPQAVAEKVAQRAAFMAEKTGLKPAGVIENMSYFVCDHGSRYELFGRGGGETLAQRLQVPLLGQIPLDPVLMEFADKGAPIVLQAGDSEVAQAYDRCAKEIANLIQPKPKGKKRISLPLSGGN
jgi:ATP-binding protein involved in chromosome partitioning